MREPIKIIGRDLSGGVGACGKRRVVEYRIVGEGKGGRGQQCVGVFRNQPPQRICGQLSRPILVKPLFERSALIRPAIVIVAGRYHWTDSRKVGRVSNRSQHLCGTDVRAAHHADFSVRVRQRSHPFDGIVAIV